MGHLQDSQRHLEAAAQADDAWVHVGIAGVHALLHLSQTLQHALRDIVYELRD